MWAGCSSSFTRLADLNRHTTYVHEPEHLDYPYAGRVYRGRTGPSSFTRPDYMNDHIREVHGQDPHASVRNRAHKRDVVRYTCLSPNCTSNFTRLTDLKRHSKAVHCPELLDCPHAHRSFCGRTGHNGFLRKDHLNEHLREVHRKNR